MCKHGNFELVEVKHSTGLRKVEIDKCIAPLIEILNANGFITISSCCGHGYQLGVIALENDVILEIYPDKETWDKFHPDITGKTICGEIINTVIYGDNGTFKEKSHVH